MFFMKNYISLPYHFTLYSCDFDALRKWSNNITRKFSSDCMEKIINGIMNIKVGSVSMSR